MSAVTNEKNAQVGYIHKVMTLQTKTIIRSAWQKTRILTGNEWDQDLGQTFISFEQFLMVLC